MRRLIFLVRSASAIRCSWNSTLFRTSALLIDTVYHGRASSPSPEIVISLAKSCDIQQRRRQQQRRQQQGAVDASDVGRQTFRRKTSQKKKHSWSSKEQQYSICGRLGLISTYIVIIGGEAAQNCDMDNCQRRQPPASNGEAIRDARAEEITPSVAGVQRRNNTAPERRSTRRRGGLTPGCSTGPAAFNVAGGRNSIDLGPRTLSRGTGIRTNKYFQHHYHQDRSSGHHRVAASAPRNNDVDRTGSRRAPRTTSQAEQSGFDSGVAAYAPRLNDGYQTGSQRSPGTTSSYSDRSSKRQRCDTSDDHDDEAIGRGDHYVEPEDHEHFGNEYHRPHGVFLAAIAPATRGMLHGNPQHPQRATKANHPRRRLAGTASGQTQPEAPTHAGSRQEQPRPHRFVKRHKKKKQSQQKQGWNKGVSPNAVW